MEFRTLATELCWQEDCLGALYLEGLSPALKDELAACEIPVSLEDLISLVTPFSTPSASSLSESPAVREKPLSWFVGRLFEGNRYCYTLLPGGHPENRCTVICRDQAVYNQKDLRDAAQDKMSLANANRSLGNDKAKSATLGSRSSQQIATDNKRRTLLQDNSWIKKRPEEETENENYGKVALSRHRSEDALDSITSGEVNDRKPIHNRFRSEDNLDRIPSKLGADKGRKATTLDRLSSGSFSSDKTPVGLGLPVSGPNKQSLSSSSTTTTTTTTTVENKRQSWTPGNRTTNVTEETKRQSWTPSSKTSTTTVETTETIHGSDQDAMPRSNLVGSTRAMFEKLDEKFKVPSPVTSPTSRTPGVPPQVPSRTDSLPSPTKDNSNRRSTTERKMRSQDLDNLIGISNTAGKNDQRNQNFDVSNTAGKNKNREHDLDNLIEIKNSTKPSKRDEELDNLIEIKSTAGNRIKRGDDLDHLIEIKSKAGKISKRDGDLDGIIDIKSPTGNRGKTQGLDNLIDVSSSTGKVNKNQGLDNLIDVSSSAGKVNKNQGLDNLIDISNNSGKFNKSQGFDDFIDVSRNAGKVNKSQGLDNLIDMSNSAGRVNNNQGLDNLINVRGTAGKDNINQGLGNLIDVRRTGKDNTSQGLDNLTNVRNTAGNDSKSQGLDNLIDVRYTSGKDSNSQGLDNLIDVRRPAGKDSTRDDTRSQYSDVTITRDPYSSSTRTTSTTRTVEYNYDTTDAPSRRSNGNYSYDTRMGSSYNTPGGQSTDTYVYTRTYEDNRKSPNDLYDDNVTAKSIKTVYSTSDQTVIEKDMCTYCRKPLGIDTKMILQDLHICCHATCFKCEVCGAPLGSLKAGDSMWIYRKTVHCDRCYSGMREKWIM
ncbi:sciellin [Rhinatrema bivittatum]|uniref:sciellin n=1 Tax=Rhinatrema bivittatum TaxID=194408 RepID=UPI00112A53AA|nr:sciellin [Rhinatrema bivittatum]